MFFNICISQARGNPEITPRMLKEAEGEYSRKRLRSLADEWAADYPFVMILFEALKGRPAQFSLSDINDEDCVSLAIKLLQEHADDEHLSGALADINRDPTKTENLRCWLAAILYRTGAIGLKLERFESTEWSTSGQRSISISEISSSARISVHPCFWRSLGINPARSSDMPELSHAGD
jgi:hypothetical protein